jgi:hypothetical protein
LWGEQGFGPGSADVLSKRMPWIRADDVFAAADAEEEALQPSPWLHRRRGPLRAKDEGQIRFKKPRVKLSLDDRLRLNQARIREAEQALVAAPNANLLQLQRSLRGYRAYAVVLQTASSRRERASDQLLSKSWPRPGGDECLPTP